MVRITERVVNTYYACIYLGKVVAKFPPSVSLRFGSLDLIVRIFQAVTFLRKHIGFMQSFVIFLLRLLWSLARWKGNSKCWRSPIRCHKCGNKMQGINCELILYLLARSVKPWVVGVASIHTNLKAHLTNLYFIC